MALTRSSQVRQTSRRRRTWGPLALALFGWLAVGCTSTPGGDAGAEPGEGGKDGNGETTEPVPPPGNGDSPIEAPVPSCLAGPGQLQKLSSLQLRNTVRELLKAAKADFALEAAETALFALPPDIRDGTFHELDDRVSLNHIAATYAVAAAVSDAIVASPERLAAVVGACASSGLEPSCVSDFVARFGRRVYRRPLTGDEKDLYTQMVKDAASPRDGVREVIVRMLMSPDFLYHFENHGRVFASDDKVVRLTSFEVASRLAFHFWRSGPDDALLDAAEDGTLDTEEGYRAAVDRVFADPRTRETLWGFYRQWFRLDGFLGFLMKNRFLASFAAGLGFEDPNKRQYDDMVEEIRLLTDHVTWKTSGGVRDLLMTDVSLSPSTLLSKLYGTPAFSGSGDPPRFAKDQRAGLLTRAAFLVTGDERTSPIHRGGFIRRSILCDEIAEPDPNSLPPGALTPPTPMPGATTRERFTAKTADNTCSGCHVLMNDIGYVLESYDGLGRHRTKEVIYDDKGAVSDTVSLNTAAVPRITESDDRTIRTPVELSKVIADSQKVEHCFARQYVRFAERRMEDEQADACVIDSIGNVLKKNGGSISDAFKHIALAPSFRVRRISK